MDVTPNNEILLDAEAAFKGVIGDPLTHGDRAARLVELARAQGLPEALVVALRAQAWARHVQLDNAGAKELLDEAVRVAARHPPLRHRLGDLLVSRAAVGHELGRLAAAQRDLDRAAGLVSGPSRTDLDLQQAALHQNIGRFAAAASLYERVLREGGSPPQVRVKVANNLGLIEAQRGRSRVALEHLDTAASLAAEVGPVLVAIVAQSRAWATMQSGMLTESLRQFESAGRLYAVAGLPLGEHYIEYADALVDLRLLREATVMVRRAAEELLAHGALLMAAEAQLRGARLALLTGDVPAAAADADAVVVSLRRQRRTAWVARARVTAVDARARGGPVSPADLRALRDAAGTLERLGLVQAAVDAHLTAGRIALAQGRRTAAAGSLQRAERLARRGAVLVRLKGHIAAALAARSTGAEAEILRHSRAGLTDLSRHRAALPSMELRALASGHGSELGALGLRALLPNGSAMRVLAWMERTRAAALVTVDSPPAEEITDELAALRSVHHELVVARRESGREPAELIQRQAALEAAIRRASWTAGETSSPSAGAGGGIGRLRGLLHDQVLVEYASLDGRLVAAVLDRRGARIAELGPIAPVAAEVDALLFALRRLARQGSPVSAKAARTSAEAGLARLAGALLEPLRLGPDVPLVLVPDAALARIPWSALHPGPVTLAPSASFWARTGERATPPDGAAGAGRVVLAAGPGLPGAVEEVGALRSLHPAAAVLLPPESTAAAVTAALDGAELAHLACHCQPRSDNPTFSSLLLSDGPLTVHELTMEGIAPRRMVLAACDSGADIAYEGNEMLGFVSALMARGTAGLVASVVPVPDVDAVPLMRALHEQLLLGSSLSCALHAARSEVGLETAGDLVSWCAFNAFGAA